MLSSRKRVPILAGLTAAAALAFAGVAWAADTIIAPSTISYSAPSYNMDRGERPNFLNTDSPDNPHNVTARGRIGGRPLFITPNVTGPTGSALVNGTQYLNTGSYEFFCSVHPDMEATLNVSGAGTPVARPDIEVKIITGKIARIAKRGRVLVRVEALTKSDNVALVLKLGKRRIASKRNIDLEAFQVRRVPLVLSDSNRNRFEDRARAKLKLVGTVQFGAPDGNQKVVK